MEMVTRGKRRRLEEEERLARHPAVGMATRAKRTRTEAEEERLDRVSRPPPRHHSAMGTVTGAERRRMEGDEERMDHVSRLPDGVLGDIVSLLPTREGARTQVYIYTRSPFLCSFYLLLQARLAGGKNAWCHKYTDLTDTLGIPLKKIVLTNYRGNTSHVNFAKFFVLNARLLESMVLRLGAGNPSRTWIETQHRLLQIKDRASSCARFDFVHRDDCFRVNAEQAHEFSTGDPFVRF